MAYRVHGTKEQNVCYFLGRENRDVDKREWHDVEDWRSLEISAEGIDGSPPLSSPPCLVPMIKTAEWNASVDISILKHKLAHIVDNIASRTNVLHRDTSRSG